MSLGRVVFAVTGSDGDVNPFVVVALQMQSRGWTTLLLAAPEHAGKAAAAGLPFAPMVPGWADIPTYAGMSAERFVHKLARDDFIMFRKLMMPSAEVAYRQARPHLDGAALVVVNHLAMGAQIAAAAAGAPMAVLALQPLVMLSAHDPPALGNGPWLPRLKQAAGPEAVRIAVEAGLALARPWSGPLVALRRLAGVPPAGGDWMRAGVRDAIATVCVWSPLLGRVQPDHPPGTVMAGSLFFEGPPPAEADEPLEAFLAAGAPPMVLSLGTVVARDAGRFFVDGLAVARRLGLRCVIVAGASAAAAAHLSAEDAFVTAYAPYSRLFPRARLVAHHGGIGACHEALRAGAPQLIAPFLSDQHDNARRVAGLGIARVVPLRRWTAERAFAAAEPLMAEAVAKRAAALARKVKAERGAELAADALEAALVARSAAPRQDSPDRAEVADPRG